VRAMRVKKGGLNERYFTSIHEQYRFHDIPLFFPSLGVILRSPEPQHEKKYDNAKDIHAHDDDTLEAYHVVAVPTLRTQDGLTWGAARP
jgi:hypothetical protein